MDGFDMGSTEVPEGTEVPDMSKGIEVGRDNNWSLGFNASMPLVNASLWKSLSISALDVELSVEQARSSKISMVNQVKKVFIMYCWQTIHTVYLKTATTMRWRTTWISRRNMNREPLPNTT